MTMNTFRTLLAATVLGAIVALPAVAPAQRYRPNEWRRQGWRRDYSRDRFTIRQRIDRTERESNAFRQAYETGFSRRDLDRFERENRLKTKIQAMDMGFERLRREANDRDRSLGRPTMENILRNARDVDRIIRDRREVGAPLRSRWVALRNEIDGLAYWFGLRPV